MESDFRTFQEIKKWIEKNGKYTVAESQDEITISGNNRKIVYNKVYNNYSHKGFGTQIAFVSSDIFHEWYSLIQAYRRERCTDEC